MNVAIATQDETQHRPRQFFCPLAAREEKTEKKGGGIELHKTKKDIALLRKPGRVRLWRVAPPPLVPRAKMKGRRGTKSAEKM